jgi:uncharacterized protein (TIGR00730 family)
MFRSDREPPAGTRSPLATTGTFEHRLGRISNIDLRQKVEAIALESLRGAELLEANGIGNFITGFGSARVPESHAEFSITERLGYLIGSRGFDLMQGAGPGHMEAFARGIQRAGRKSIGNNIICSSLFEQAPHPYNDLMLDNTQLGSRKLLFLEADAFVFRPGGVGTDDEDTEVCANVQLGIMSEKPMFFVGRWFWEPHFEHLTQHRLGNGFISEKDLQRRVITDDLEYVADTIAAHHARRCVAA